MTCPECGEQFEPKNNQQLFCTRKCRSRRNGQLSNQRRLAKQRANPKPRKVRVRKVDIRHCRHCNAEFVPISCSNRQYCTDGCRVKASNDKKAKRRSYIGSYDAKECAHCQKPIIATGLCYDCFNPGGRYIARAAWLFGNNRSRRLNPAA